MHAHTCRLDSLYETLPFCNCTSSDKKIVTEGEGEEARNLSSIQSKWGVNGSFFIREQLSKQGPVGERVGRAAQRQLNTEKRPFHACGNTSTVMMVSDGDTMVLWYMQWFWIITIFIYHDIYSMIQKSKNLLFKKKKN